MGGVPLLITDALKSAENMVDPSRIVFGRFMLHPSSKMGFGFRVYRVSDLVL